MKKFIFLAFFITFIAFLMTLSIYFYYSIPISKHYYSASAFVTVDTSGFDINSSSLTFGSFALGGSSTRTIFVNNSYSFPIRLEPHAEGSISKILSYQPLTLEPYQTGELYLTVSTNSPELLGNYSGNVSIYLLRAF